MRLLATTILVASSSLLLVACPEAEPSADSAVSDIQVDVAQEASIGDVVLDAAAETTKDDAVDDISAVDGDVSADDVAAETQTDAGGDTGLPGGPIFKTTIGDWTMSPGQETTKCSIRKLDNATTINVAAIRTKLAPGSHHLIVYKVADEPEQTTPFNCTPFVDTLGGSAAPLMITQVPDETLTFPPGVVLELEPNQTIRLEAHYLNYFPSDIVAHADVEFFTTEETDVVKADFLFYGTTNVLLPPNQEVSNDWTHLDVPNGAKVFAVTGHTHEMGTNVEVTKSTSASDPGTALYPLDETFLWDEAPVTYHTPPVEFGPGEGFRFRCTWNNTSNSFITFGESANKEMCFLWAYYYPSQGFRLCADGLFGCPSDG